MQASIISETSSSKLEAIVLWETRKSCFLPASAASLRKECGNSMGFARVHPESQGFPRNRIDLRYSVRDRGQYRGTVGSTLAGVEL